MTKIFFVAAFLALALAGCESEPKFALGLATMDCDHGSCVVTFDVTNISDGTLPLIYDISLSQNHIRDPNKSGLVVVGATGGAIDLPPKETKTIEVEIEVTETPNGSKVSVFDSRTPKFILEILNS